ncbi:DMP19 family protein [Rubritalea tangerina]|uniref:DMP19 family protein n=2 Tax=Rubritalea tangerina TaxID=430798 RepID=UPI00361DB774
MQYEHSELERLQGADLVFTMESLGEVPHALEEYSDIYKFQHLLCSKRFRDWAVSESLPLTFTPVQFGETLRTDNVLASTKVEDPHARRVKLSEEIAAKIDHDDARVGELSPNERAVYCLERLSVLVNMTGADKFFDSSVGPLYLPITEGLKVIGAEGMLEYLQKSKEICLEGLEPSEQNILDAELEIAERVDAASEELNGLFTNYVESEFHHKLREFEDALVASQEVMA